MKWYFTGLAIAALLVIGPTLPGYAEDAPAAPAATQAEPATAPAASKTAEPGAKSAPDAQPRHRRYAHRHWRHYGYRTAYWQPFPIFWPHVYRNRIHWNRIPWAFRF
jgi:hypothetical protein